MGISSGREVEFAALVLALLILLQLWIELRQIRRSAREAAGKAFLQVQMHRDRQAKPASSFGVKQPGPGDSDESEQSLNRPSGGH